MNKINIGLFFLFSFFLAFGKFDPFGTEGLYFDVITISLILSMVLTTDVIKKIKIFQKQLSILFSIGFILFFVGLFYGQISFNFKYFAAIIIFWLMSYFFKRNPKIAIYSILAFSISCSFIAILYNLGYLDSQFIVRNGRLLIFDENPNSISSRMAISFIILTYIIVDNPLNFSKVRFLFVSVLPSIFLFIIATGSRGSFLILILGITLIFIFANIHKGYKFLFGAGMVIPFIILVNFLKTTNLIERFISSTTALGGREEIWSKAIQIFYDYPFGVGEVGYYTEMIQRFSYNKDPHNLFLYLLITGGFVSLILFLLFSKKLFLISYYHFKNGNSLLMIIFLFFIFLAAKTGGILSYLVMWYFFAFINSLERIKLNTNE